MILATDESNLFLRFFLYLIAWGCLIFFPHCLTHFIVGSVVGIRFECYGLGKSGMSKLGWPIVGTLAALVPVLTLKTDRKSLNSVSPGRRAVMFASGAVASMILPFIVGVASITYLPITLAAVIFVLSIANLVFDLYYSPKAGDFSRARAR